MKTEKIIQVCTEDCGNNLFKTKVGKMTHTFCCEKGFQQSLKDFAKIVKK